LIPEEPTGAPRKDALVGHIEKRRKSPPKYESILKPIIALPICEIIPIFSALLFPGCILTSS
jgi:hypothetical protein